MNNIFEELSKCHNSFVYFVDTYIKVIHPKKGLIQLKLYDYQKRLAKAYDDNNFVISAKFRQGGFSTITALYGLWKCLFSTDQRFLFLSKTDREARSLSKVVGNAINNLPEQFKPLLANNNDHVKEFSCTGSTMHFFTPQAACGRSMTHLVIDDAAFIKDMDEHWTSLWPTLCTGGKCFVVSTINGIGNWFEEKYNGALDGKNNFYVFSANYKEHPEYQNEEWMKQIRKNLGPKAFMQEFECNFLGSQPTAEDILRYKMIDIVDNPNLTRKDMLHKIACEILEEYET